MDKIKSNGMSGAASALIIALDNLSTELGTVLSVLEDQKVRVLHMETRSARERGTGHDVYVEIDVTGQQLAALLDALKRKRVLNVQVHSVKPKRSAAEKLKHHYLSLDSGDTKYMPNGIPWFPRTASDLDQSSKRVLMYGAQLDADHPGFKDEVYRKRRVEFVDIAMNYKHGQPIPRVEYNEVETKTWSTIYQELLKLYPTHACKEYLQNLPLLQTHCGYSEKNIPQLEDISIFLRQKTGFTLRPVAGYLSSRDFLAGLAFRVFHCTQYIRHSRDPFYTPEPDCCHELMGHMPLFLDPNFAEFSQEIGLASLGASDEDVQKLATCYFFSVEFGLCKQQGEMRVFGAGLLSSIGELKHVLSDKAVKKPFDPETVCQTECLITTFQNAYFYSESFEEAKEKLRQFARSVSRPFELLYDPFTQSVLVLDHPTSVAKAFDDLHNQMGILSSALKKLDVH